MLIPAVGWTAVYRFGKGKKTGFERRSLAAWTEDHEGYVVGLITDDKSGTLRSAESYANFEKYVGPSAYSGEATKQLIPMPNPHYYSVEESESSKEFYRIIALSVSDMRGIEPVVLTDCFQTPDKFTECVYLPNETREWWSEPIPEKES